MQLRILTTIKLFTVHTGGFHEFQIQFENAENLSDSISFFNQKYKKKNSNLTIILIGRKNRENVPENYQIRVYKMYSIIFFLLIH